jgi:hypothetical protein
VEAQIVPLGQVASIRQGLITSGRGAGARGGDWRIHLVSVGDIQDDRLDLGRAQTIQVEQNVKTEKHLLQADDVLVTARSTLLKVALVAPPTQAIAADSTLLVIRADEQVPDLGPLRWWYLSSSIGRSRIEARMTGSTVLALPINSLAQLEVPIPDAVTMRLIADLVTASERAYSAALEAAGTRRTVFRDALMDRLLGAAN